jgi:hypothetical protein
MAVGYVNDDAQPGGAGYAPLIDMARTRLLPPGGSPARPGCCTAPGRRLGWQP